MLDDARLRAHHFWNWVQRVVPGSCTLCGTAGGDAICPDCRIRYISTRQHRCAQCALPLANAHHGARCGACLASPPCFDATIVATDYAPPVDQLVLLLKFGGRLALAPMFAQLLADSAGRYFGESRPQLLTAVPLGSHRLAQRGFNQSLEIARPLARMLSVPLAPRLLHRVRETQAQAQLPHDERNRNIRQAFTVSEKMLDQMRDCHIGVVDDVMTTGETMNEVAATLKRYGATRVTNLVFSRTLPRTG